MTLSIENFKPKKHPKYSPNLYKWLRKRKKTFQSLEIFSDEHNRLWIGNIIYNNNGAEMLHGCLLMRILCNGSKSDFMSYLVSGHFTGPLTPVLDFWEQYEKLGRCAIDKDHQINFIDESSRWKTNDDERECLWCNNYKQKLITEEKIVKQQRWIKQ